MADAIAGFKKAVRETVAKDLRRVGFWMVRLSNRLDPAEGRAVVRLFSGWDPERPLGPPRIDP